MALTELQPRIAIVKYPGTNCEVETAYGITLAGGVPDIVLNHDLEVGNVQLPEYQGIIFAGGFSYGDDLGSGRVAALKLDSKYGNQVERFKENGGISLGICNGNQIMAQSEQFFVDDNGRELTLDRNDKAHFNSDRVKLIYEPNNRCVWLRDLEEYGPVEFQVAHGEGKYVFVTPQKLQELETEGRILFRYAGKDGKPTSLYPLNPNGSVNGIAGVVDRTGRHAALMPHPERSIKLTQYANWRRMQADFVPEGLIFLEQFVAHAKQAA